MRRVLGTAIADYAPPLGLLALTIIYLIIGYQYPPVSRMFPVMVAWSMIVLVALDLASRTQTRAGRTMAYWLNPASATAEHKAAQSAAELSAIIWLAAFVAALVLVGILYAIPLFVFASVRWRGKRSYAASFAVAAVTTLCIWLMFARLLRIELYPGLLLGSG
jgi:tripartite tricarboxylate transporter TctB family protein